MVIASYRVKISDANYKGGSNKAGLANGQGTYTWGNGDAYEGKWKDGKPRGRGKIIFPSGNVYEGEWRDNKRHGNGKFTWASGNVYKGGWRDNKCHGHGKMTYANGNVYDGEWKDNKIHRHGKYTWPDHSTYEGGLKDGKKHGQGTFTYADGDIYEGQWKDDKKYRGTYYTMSCRENGEIVGFYTGAWKNVVGIGNAADGQGKYVNVNGDRSIYECGYKDGEKHGHGKVTKIDGTSYEGRWEQDELIAEFVGSDELEGNRFNRIEKDQKIQATASSYKFGWGRTPNYEELWVGEVTGYNGKKYTVNWLWRTDKHGNRFEIDAKYRRVTPMSFTNMGQVISNRRRRRLLSQQFPPFNAMRNDLKSEE